MTAQAVETLKPVDQLPLAAPRQATPLMEMISEAVRAGQSIDVIRELKAMAKEVADDEAQRAFEAAMSAAKAEMPAIVKNRTVDFSTSKGRTHYQHEDLGGIARAIDPILGKHGLSYRFETTTEARQVKVTCVVSHRDGHSVRNELSAGHDESGNKNSIQAIGSTITYLQRYTLKAALGLAASQDDDGARADKTADAFLSPAQVATVQDLIDKTDTDIEKFCTTFKVESLPELRVLDFDNAVKSLNIKLARKLSEAENA